MKLLAVVDAPEPEPGNLLDRYAILGTARLLVLLLLSSFAIAKLRDAVDAHRTS